MEDSFARLAQEYTDEVPERTTEQTNVPESADAFFRRAMDATTHRDAPLQAHSVTSPFDKAIADTAKDAEIRHVGITRQQRTFLAPGMLSSQPYKITDSRIVLNAYQGASLASAAFFILTDRYRNVVAFGTGGNSLAGLDIAVEGLYVYAAVAADFQSFALNPYWAPTTVIAPGDTNSNATSVIVYYRELQ